MNRRILHIALPSIVSNIAVPLLGIVDTAIVGHLGSATYIGAISVGALLFNMIYWGFGFLRQGTGGLTSQSYGSGNLDECALILLRSLLLGGVISLLLILFRRPISEVAFLIISPSPEVREMSRVYYDILIWGAPAALSLYGLMGWFLGMQRATYVMYIVVCQNAINIPVSLYLVYVCGMKVEGVAIGTLVAQYGALLLAVSLLYLKYRDSFQRCLLGRIFDGKQIRRFFSVNTDIFLRTLCLIAVTTGFTSIGAQQGTVDLAANALLMQFFLFFSYVIDGFAFAGEALGGSYFGARDYRNFRKSVSVLFLWGSVLSLLFCIIYLLLGDYILRLLTSDASTILYAEKFLPFIVLLPLIGFSAFLMDGVFIGITHTRQMLLSVLLATFCFFLISPMGVGESNNYFLWSAFLSYLGCRGIVLLVLYKVSVLSKF